MRLIDADALEKAIYEWMPKDQSTWMDSDLPPIENLVVSIMMTIQEQPTVDAVPVIRCKDCKHMGDVYLVSLPWLEQKEHRCRYWEHPTTPDDYCSRAERKHE